MRDAPSNTDDVIDSRDVIQRIEELESDRESIDGDAENETDSEAIKEALEAWDSENGEELKALKAFQDQAEGYCDWESGETLIRDGYFEKYAQQFADDIGAMQDGNPHKWPFTCIDWGQAADELKQDYTSVEFNGETYWVR